MPTNRETRFHGLPSVKLVSVSAVSKEFKISHRTIYYLIHNQTFEAIKVGNRWKILLQSVKDFINRGEY